MTGGNDDFNLCAGLRELLTGMAVPLGIGAVAGFMNLMRKGGNLSWRQRTISFVTSVFVAVLTFWGLDMLELPSTVDAAIIGAFAYMGGSFLDAVQSRTLREVRHGKGIFKDGE